MSVVKVKSSTSAGANLSYILDGSAHNNKLTNHRYLGATGKNVELDYFNKLNAKFLACQYEASRRHAMNENKKTQAQHLIFSFSKDEFDGSDLKEQSQQMLKLVGGALNKRLPKNSQYLAVSQIDGESNMMHCHAVVNSVLTNGKVLNTNLISVTGKDNLRDFMDNYLSDNFEKITGREYEPINHLADSSDVVKSSEYEPNKRGAYVWKNDLKGRIIESFSATDNMQDFEKSLALRGVSVRHRRAGTGKKDADGKKEYRDALTYYFDDVDGKQRKIKDFSYSRQGTQKGLGLDFTPDSMTKEWESIKASNRLIADEDEEENEFALKTKELEHNGTIKETKSISESDESIEPIEFGDFDVSNSVERLNRKRRRIEKERQKQRRKQQADKQEREDSIDESSGSLRRSKSERPNTNQPKRDDKQQPRREPEIIEHDEPEDDGPYF